MSDRIYDCQQKGCTHYAYSRIKVGPTRSFMYLCRVHRDRFHVLKYAEMIRVHKEAKPQHYVWVGNS